MKHVIFDLDGCISDDEWRLPMILKSGKNRWDEYHANACRDQPMNVNALQHHIDQGDRILFVTARPEEYRSNTWSWILRHFGEQGDWILLMRPDDDESPSPELKPWLLDKYNYKPEDIIAAYDDRWDVLESYRSWGIPVTVLLGKRAAAKTVPGILHDMAETFENRNAIYGTNYKRVAPIIAQLFPEGVPSELVLSDRWHLFELLVVKLTRFAISGLTHTDSIHDAAIYAAMIQSDLEGK